MKEPYRNMSILHISDLHFGTEQPAVLEALVQLSQANNPRLLILSGDITQRAKSEEFAAARQFVDRLQLPAQVIIPGNHDIPLYDLAARAFSPYARYSKAFGDDLEPVFESAELLVIGVNTTRRYRHIDGEVSNDQIEFVADKLRHAAPTQLRIVVTHQPVCVIKKEDEKDLLNGHEAAIRSWSEAGADMILGGHIHRPYMCPLHEKMSGLPRPIWALQAGTALSSRVRYEVGNSLNLIRPGQQGTARQCVVERWDYDAGTQAFAMHSARTIVCG